MAIGDTRLGSQVINLPTVQVPAGAFGAGVAAAIGNVAQQAQNLGIQQAAVNEYLKKKRDAEVKVDADTRLIQMTGKLDRQIEESAHSAQPGASGYTDATYAELTKAGDEFLKTIPQEFRGEYAERYESFKQNRTTAAFKFEQDSGDAHFKTQIDQITIEAQSEVRNNPKAFQSSYDYIKAAIDKTTLPPATKEAMAQQAFNSLAAVEFQTTAERAALGLTPVRPPDGSDVVAPGMPAVARGILNGVASKESPDYNTITGGQKFTDYSDHPRVRVPLPDGDFSTAAGRYQFTASTWDEAAAALGLQDFSPVSQDRAAWWLAQRDYKARTGRDLSRMLESGDFNAIADVRKILEPTWTGLVNMSDAQFSGFITGLKGMAGGGTGDVERPNLWSDPRYAGLDYATKIGLEGDADRIVAASRQAEQQQAQVRETAAYNTLVAAIGQGTAGDRDVEIAIANGDIQDGGHMNALRNSVKGEREQREAAGRALGNMQDPSYVFTQEDDKDIATLYTKNGLAEGIGQMDEAAATMAQNLVVRTGRVPAPMAQQLDTMISGSPQQQEYALNLAAQLSESNVAAFQAGASKELAAAAAYWRTASQYNTDPQAALTQFNTWRDPENLAMRTRYEEGADKLLKEKGPGDALEVLGGGSTFLGLFKFSGAPQMPSDFPSQALLFNDYSSLFRMYYPMMQGDEKKTNAMVGQVMAKQWAPNTLDGTNKLMKYAPSAPGSGIPQVNGSQAWADLQIRDALGYTSDQKYEMVSDGQTAAEFGTAPSYKIIRQNPDGVWELEFDPANPGVPLRVHPTITEELRHDIGDQVKVQNLQTKMMEEPDPLKALDILNKFTTLEESRRTIPQADIQRRIDALDKQLQYLHSHFDGMPPTEISGPTDEFIKEAEKKRADLIKLRGEPQAIDRSRAGPE